MDGKFGVHALVFTDQWNTANARAIAVRNRVAVMGLSVS